MTIWTLGIPTPVALALVALIGYLIGCRTQRTMAVVRESGQRELKRAKAVIRELEQIAQKIRRSLASHHTNILHFKDRVTQLSKHQDETDWNELCSEAERMLKPTLQLSSQIALAYDQIGQQTNLLMTFTEVRTDPLTGLRNRRALEDSLQSMFAMMTRYGTKFSLAIFDVDHFKSINDEHGHIHGDRVLQEIAEVFDAGARETDIVVRYGGEEFIVLMPETELDGASLFSERARERVEALTSLTVSGGVACAEEVDDPQTLINRADTAMYSAKAAGRNLVFCHNGERIEPVAALENPGEVETDKESAGSSVLVENAT